MRLHGFECCLLRVARSAVCKLINGSRSQNLSRKFSLEASATEEKMRMAWSRRCGAACDSIIGTSRQNLSVDVLLQGSF